MSDIRLSVIVVTSGRDTLSRTLESIAAQPLAHDDEVLVVGKGEKVESAAEAFRFRYVEDGPFGCWGQRERQAAMKEAKGTHLLFMDDDDAYTEGAFAAIRRALEADPDALHMFSMIEPLLGERIWRDTELRCGNVSGTQFIVPNDPVKLGTWGLRREGDWDFIQSTTALYELGVRWHEEVIAVCRDRGKPARRAS